MPEERVATLDIWTFEIQPPLAGVDLAGYSVEATDGMIGKVSEANLETSSSYLVVDAGPWIYGNKTVLLPAGIVTGIDEKIGTVFVNRTQEEIANAPEFEAETGRDDKDFRDRVAGYYRR